MEGPESVIDQDGQKLRLFDVDRMPANFIAGLLPEQRELLEEMLGKEMGSKPWGGRRRRG